MTSEQLNVARSAPLRDQVYDAIEAMIVDHVLAPGERLVETDLAKRLDVSRNPVREAMTALVRAGWVTLKPYAGAVVAEQRESDVAECFRVRSLLESEAARVAAERVRDGDAATSSSAERLRLLIQDIDSSLASSNAEMIKANAQFHGLIVEMSGNSLIRQFTETLNKRIRWFYGAVGLSHTSDSWREHVSIGEAVLAGEPDVAADAMGQHIERTWETVRERWLAAR